MSEAERAELRRLLAEATPGPWSRRSNPNGGARIGTAYVGVADVLSRAGVPHPVQRHCETNADLIVALVNAAPALLDELDRLAARVAEEERNRELVRERDEAWAFLRRTAMTGGSIVSSASMTPRQIAIARAADRMLVMPDGYGFVYVPGPRFCACGRPESDCDQSRAGCPKEEDPDDE